MSKLLIIARCYQATASRRKEPQSSPILAGIYKWAKDNKWTLCRSDMNWVKIYESPNKLACLQLSFYSEDFEIDLLTRATFASDWKPVWESDQETLPEIIAILNNFFKKNKTR